MEILVTDKNGNIELKKTFNFLDSAMRIIKKYQEKVVNNAYIININKEKSKTTITLNATNIKGIVLLLKLYEKEK